MEVPIEQADGRLADLIRHAETGDAVVLTRDGKPAATLVPFEQLPLAERRRILLDELKRNVRGKALLGPDGARSQDFLYDEYGLPA